MAGGNLTPGHGGTEKLTESASLVCCSQPNCERANERKWQPPVERLYMCKSRSCFIMCWWGMSLTHVVEFVVAAPLIVAGLIDVTRLRTASVAKDIPVNRMAQNIDAELSRLYSS